MIRQYSYAIQKHISFSENLDECLDKLESYYNGNNLLGVIFFIDSNSDAEYFEMKKCIQNALNQKKWMMPFNVQAQSGNSILSFEIWTDDSAEKTEYLSLADTRYTRVTSAKGKSIWGIGITSNEAHLQLTDQIEFSFETVLQILEKEGMTLADIVRQWNYIPGILNIREMEGKHLQSYQVFNEIRQKYYSANVFSDGYPAATGIGTRNGNFDLDFFAIKSGPCVQKVGLSNPKQQNAYEYHQTFLVGDTTAGQIKKTPLFERAKMLKTDDETIIFISGTASIIGQETIGIGDIKCQTEITIDNMQELIPNSDDLKKIQFTYLRAYIKEEQDFQIVKSICESSFPGVSVSYLQADVCRDNLLVELEGAVFVGS
jgi:enamine deaminase RidA (YjgF/YER057c/UK114 family)